ncbi:type II toxin-antitoxin system HipA family toxin [Desulfocurvibacter africanus]|uniref:type II toxin-antitoxin system HipA family toxin n=1 Tax=Desulfocurvibacter africanus TaxID=873 RepID=UPI0003F7572D|nr:type II toxin-antitoxin system HipA family toxin [Desulfocurvibacter africanus]
MNRELLVHMDLQGTPHFVGRLWIHVSKGTELASFEYAPSWLASPLRFALEPALKIGEGQFHTPAGRVLFGFMGDSAPDRWGRALMRRKERREATLENRTERTLLEADFLLLVSDVSRQGALRFSGSQGGEFLAPGGLQSIPPFIHLGRLLAASERILANRETDEDLRDLFAPGSSLGGARPKASVMGNDGRLYIAKFPDAQDEWDVELWEYLALTMAREAGLNVPNFRLEKVAGKSVLLLERFDRDGGGVRIPFLSAMSMLEATDGEQRSYLEIAESLQRYGAQRVADVQELWRRIVFNIMVSNVDDHLRNHGFLHAGPEGWRLSPVYDLEPTPASRKPRVLQTFIDLDDGTASLDLALSVAEEFGLDPKRAGEIAHQVGCAVRSWKDQASKLGVRREEIDFMSTAFEHENHRKTLLGPSVKAVGQTYDAGDPHPR